MWGGIRRTSGTEQQSGGLLWPRATKRPQARESNPAGDAKKKHFRRSAFFNEIHPSGGWNIASQCEMRLTAREIAAAVGGFYFAFCGAENFTTAERLFHILHMQNISLIFNVELIRLFFLLLESVSETWRTSGTEQQSGGLLCRNNYTVWLYNYQPANAYEKLSINYDILS